jgi:hypothetical protein
MRDAVFTSGVIEVGTAAVFIVLDTSAVQCAHKVKRQSLSTRPVEVNDVSQRIYENSRQFARQFF